MVVDYIKVTSSMRAYVELKDWGLHLLALPCSLALPCNLAPYENHQAHVFHIQLRTQTRQPFEYFIINLQPWFIVSVLVFSCM